MAQKNIEISKIVADEKWNVRSIGWKQSSGDETAHDFDLLVASIKEHGVQTAILVRPNPKKADTFLLVAGFRRLAAATAAGLKVIPATVKELSDAQARAENIRENTEREDLGVADLVFGVKELDAAMAPKSMTETELGSAIGKSQTYAGKLRKLAHGLTADVLKKWRESRVAIKYADMLVIAGLDAAKQAEAFAKLVGSKEEGEEEKGKSGKAGQLEKLKKQAAHIGHVLGTAMFLEVIKEQEVDFAVFPWDDFMDLKTELKGKNLKAVVEAAEEAFSEAVDPSEDDAAE